MTQVFISYSRKDISFVDKLVADLQKAGLDVWYDVSHIAGGARWRSEIENALRNSQYVIVVLSPDSIISEWVEREFLFSSNLRRKIIPVMYRPCEVPLNYVDLNYIDVQGENYGRNFNQLLNALSVEPTTTTQPASRAGSAGFKWKSQYLALLGGGAVLTVVLLGLFLVRGSFAPKAAATERGIATEVLATPTVTSIPASATPAPSDITDAQGINMVLVPTGKFIMGSNSGNLDERPAREVELDAFYMDLYEVTNSSYQICVIAGACTRPALEALGSFLTNYYDEPEYGDYPVVYVNWFQARSYCRWRGAKLPTEAQWEKAARGTDSPIYPWGPYISCDRANYGYCTQSTSAVGSYAEGTSPYGLHDMAGNVWEWTADWYSDAYYQTSPFPSNPTGPDTGLFRVLRGGSFADDDKSQRSSFRNKDLPENFNWNIGFRCARGTGG